MFEQLAETQCRVPCEAHHLRGPRRAFAPRLHPARNAVAVEVDGERSLLPLLEVADDALPPALALRRESTFVVGRGVRFEAEDLHACTAGFVHDDACAYHFRVVEHQHGPFGQLSADAAETGLREDAPTVHEQPRCIAFVGRETRDAFVGQRIVEIRYVDAVFWCHACAGRIWRTARPHPVVKKKRDPHAPVSRVLCVPRLAPRHVSAIYLRLRSPAGSSGLPPGSGRATLECRYTWPCNPQVVRPRVSPRRSVGSYPAFSPLPRTGAVVFCYLDCALTDIYPLGSAVLCVARTFLSPSRGSGGTSRRALRAAKVVIIGGNPTASPDYSASGRSDGGAFGRCPKRRGGPSAER